MHTLKFLVLAGALSTPVVAAQNDFDFEQHDSNGDGYLTEAEWQDAGVVAADFSNVDNNGDGYLDEQEVQAVVAQRGTTQVPVSNPDSTLAADPGEITPEEDYRGTGYDPLANDPAQNNPASIETEAATADGIDADARHDAAVSELDSNQDGRASRQEVADDPELAAHFIIWDTNQDGYLDQQEVDDGRQQSPNTTENTSSDDTQSERDISIEQQDVDGDGRISREETSQAAEFDTMDSNRDGYLDAAEVNYEPGERDVADAAGFEDYDTDGDRRLSRTEAANDTYLNANFDSWDNNNDNHLDEEEVNNGWLSESTTSPESEDWPELN